MGCGGSKDSTNVADSQKAPTSENKIINDENTTEGEGQVQAPPAVPAQTEGEGQAPPEVPPSVMISLQKDLAEDSLGLTLIHLDGKQLRVTVVKEKGLVPKWNIEADPERKVYPNDLIIKVNGIAGDSKKMVEAYQTTTGEILLEIIHGDGYKTASVANEPDAVDGEPAIEPGADADEKPGSSGEQPPKNSTEESMSQPPQNPVGQPPKNSTDDTNVISGDTGENKTEEPKDCGCF
jgi:hypothetical protein